MALDRSSTAGGKFRDIMALLRGVRLDFFITEIVSAEGVWHCLLKPQVATVGSDVHIMLSYFAHYDHIQDEEDEYGKWKANY